RRRHTRCYRDWSSDVCSSDLLESGVVLHIHHLDIIPGDGNNLSSPLIDHRNFRSAIHRTQKRLLLTSEDTDRSDPSLGRSVLAWLCIFDISFYVRCTVYDLIMSL